MRILLSILIAFLVCTTLTVADDVEGSLRKWWGNVAVYTVHRHHIYQKFLNILRKAAPAGAVKLKTTASALRKAHTLLTPWADQIVFYLKEYMIAVREELSLESLEYNKKQAIDSIHLEAKISSIMDKIYKKYFWPTDKTEKPPLLIKEVDKTTEQEDKDFKKFTNFVRLMTRDGSTFNSEMANTTNSRGSTNPVPLNVVETFRRKLKDFEELVQRFQDEVLPELENAHKYVVDPDFLKNTSEVANLLKTRTQA